MVHRLLKVLLLVGATACWPAGQAGHTYTEPACSNGPSGDACRCDPSCAQYGDCCLDAPSFVSEQQRHGASLFTCSDKDVYMMSSCPAEWKDPSTRYRCEHHDTSYRDPLFDVPITSSRTNITYSNRHCALCHHDLDVGTSNIWSIYFSCEDAWTDLDDEEIINYLVYNTTTSSWILNITENPEFMIFQNYKQVYSCKVGVQAPEELLEVMRACDSSTVNVCPEDWTDEEVRALCEAYSVHTCLSSTVYRNQYCGMCNNNGSFQGSVCLDVGTRLKTTPRPPDFTVLLDWHRLRRRDTCQQVTEEYDPFTRTCRPVFVEAEGLGIEASEVDISAEVPYEINSGIAVADMVAENYTSASVNETCASILDTCLKIRLEAHEYYIKDNDSMVVFIPAYNATLRPCEYRIGNDSRLNICLPEFGTENVGESVKGLGYITMVGVSLSIFFLVLHLLIFGMTPKLCNLSSMNLASLSASLLLMYCAFFAGMFLQQTRVPCCVMAVIIHYGLLASFCWMLTIAYDINRVLRQATKQLLVSRGKHWQRFVLYSLWSWMAPAIIIGAALGAEFSGDEMLEYVRPGYGTNDCWISRASGLLIFVVAPLVVVMVLNAVFFFWSAYLICSTTSMLQNLSRTRKDFRLYVRLALIMGLTWVTGLIAGFADVLVLWYAFVLLNTLQGLFIFLSFSCTRKVWHGLCAEQALQHPREAQEAKSAFTPGTATTNT